MNKYFVLVRKRDNAVFFHTIDMLKLHNYADLSGEAGFYKVNVYIDGESDFNMVAKSDQIFVDKSLTIPLITDKRCYF